MTGAVCEFGMIETIFLPDNNWKVKGLIVMNLMDVLVILFYACGLDIILSGWWLLFSLSFLTLQRPSLTGLVGPDSAGSTCYPSRSTSLVTRRY